MPGRPGNLPVETTSFIGRTRELFDARKVLSHARVLTLIGVGGVGKTRLAVRLGEEMVRAFPGGTWLADLGRLEPGSSVAGTVSSALGLDEPAPSATSVAKHLAGKELLLILDNCEHLLEECAEFVTTLTRQATQVRILITSREPLGILGEHILEVKPLSVPTSSADVSPATLAGYEAVHLFADRASSSVPSFTLTPSTAITVAEVCQRLDGIPLAIELAALRLRALSPHELLDRLDDQHQLLTVGSRIAQPRQRSLSALNEWSYELCSDNERELWCRLSVFADTFDLADVEAVCADPPITEGEMGALIAGLVEKSVVVRVDEGVDALYQMMETIRRYGAARLRDGGHRLTFQQRHAEYFARLGSQITQDLAAGGSANANATLRRVRGNLAEASTYLRKVPGHEDHALTLSSLLYLCPGEPSSLAEERVRLHHALQDSRDATPARAFALSVDSLDRLMAGDLKESAAALAECRQTADELEDAQSMAYVTEYEALHEATDDLDAGFTGLLQAFRAHAQASNVQGMQQCFRHLLVVGWLMDDEHALERTAAQTEIHQALQETSWAPHAAFSNGLQALRGHAPTEAAAKFREALLGLRAAGESRWTALCFDALAHCAWAAREYVRATRLLSFARNVRSLLGMGESFVGGSLDPHGTRYADLRRQLGAEQFAAAADSGGDMTVAEAVEYAMDVAPAGRDQEISVEDAALTPRERDVAELVCQGLTNQEIGEALSISKRTIESHIEHIMTKLGFTRRTQIATWFTRASTGGEDGQSAAGS